MSTLESPLMFLRTLKDNELIEDELYQKLEVSTNDSDLYNVLESIQKRGMKTVRKFWNCVDQEHIVQRYPQVSEIISELMKDLENPLNQKIRPRSVDKSTGQEREIKKIKIESISERNEAGPSSQSTYCQRKIAEHVERGLQCSPDSRTEDSSFLLSTSSVKLWDMPEHKKWLPVTCGEEEALLDREALFDRKKNCIEHNGEMITPFTFEERGGKESCKSWKTSILCQGKTVSSLMELEILKMPKRKGKFTLRN
ncbi:uncharacterized protein si:dkey-68o6.8 isoform X1 [Danio rerio]|uniref:Si:dkey-68o6.8 n=7 Tax=Danio rerio TaxID=7955 RepID=A0A0R4IMH4_DANRE|nr:uncharacterized protein si:dkey-68o6.8 isoform X1 [Danio rerio]|eukprot:XP_017210252.1 uncharacterized protein si:dkey-68o6.8 isoform X1 [Danio rerio]